MVLELSSIGVAWSSDALQGVCCPSLRALRALHESFQREELGLLYYDLSLLGLYLLENLERRMERGRFSGRAQTMLSTPPSSKALIAICHSSLQALMTALCEKASLFGAMHFQCNM